MAITVTCSFGNTSSPRTSQPLNGVVTVTNNGSNTIELMSMQVVEASVLGAVVSGPYFLTPNAYPGVGPELSASASGSYPFQVVVQSPNVSGAAPSAPNAIRMATWPTPNSWCQLHCNVVAYDSTAGENVVGSATLNFPVVSAVASYPPPITGGTEQFNYAANAVNWFFF